MRKNSSRENRSLFPSRNFKRQTKGGREIFIQGKVKKGSILFAVEDKFSSQVSSLDRSCRSLDWSPSTEVLMFAILLVSSRSRERRINQTRLYSDNHYFDEYKMDIYPFQGTGV